jgi:RecA-family ATPase
MSELLADFLTKEIKHNPQIIGRGVLPVQSLAVIGGQPKHNKSFVVLNMILNLARGENIFNATYPSGVPVLPVMKRQRVLYIEQEIGEEGMRERLMPMLEGELGYGLDLYVKSRDMDLRLDTSEGKIAIANEIASCKPDVVILDPLAEFQLINENSAQEMGATLRVCKRWIDAFKTSVVIVHHVGKQSEENPKQGGDKLRGSSALFGAVDTFIGVTRKSEASHPTPVLELEFEIRRGKPLHSMYVRREESGLITYLGEQLPGGRKAAENPDYNPQEERKMAKLERISKQGVSEHVLNADT